MKITVIGAGPGGYVAAIRAAQLGAEVTIIEAEHPGGTCLNRGCISSKIMATTAMMMERFKHATEFGIETNGDICLNIHRLMERKTSIIETQIKGISALLQRHKIRYVEGLGYISGMGQAVIQRPGCGQIDIEWDRLIIATGSVPIELPFMPFDGERILSSDHVLNLTSIPESVMIIGGGVIGCEFAFILSAFGAKVTIVEAMPRLLPLPSVDEDCSKILQREMKKQNIKIMLNRMVEGFEEKEGKLCVTIGNSPFIQSLSEKDKMRVTENIEKILVCIGRKPNTADIGLESVGVKTDDRGWITADESMKTSANNIYAVGDILGPSKIMLAHVASAEGKVAAENAVDGNQKMNYQIVPGAIFTMPEIANVGLSESVARADVGTRVQADTVLFRVIGKSVAIGEIAGQAKIISDGETGKVLGVHIIGPHATDLIAEAALCMQMGGTVRDIAQTIHAHPTLSEIMSETAFAALHNKG